MALAYSNPETNAGAAIIFDMAKHKVYRQYPLGSVTSLAWTQSGDTLFAGTTLLAIPLPLC
jgi:hypothetical protein